jgi:hypothetical protein
MVVNDIVFSPFFALFFYVILSFFAFAMRFELFSIQNQSVIFDKKNRKVYRVFRDTPSIVSYCKNAYKAAFSPWPITATSSDWDCLDFIQLRKTVMMGGVPSTMHGLGVMVRESKDSHTFIDSFTVGNAIAMGENGPPALFEYIRRYMEENGPALPAGDKIAQPRPNSWWQSLGAVSPIGPNWRAWWGESPILFCIIVLSYPLTFPFILPWSIFNWLANKTAITLEWPDDVKASWGPQIKPQ